MSIEGEPFDVIVIGGGASGMMAAGRAGARGLRVLLLEKNNELGKKLSITGGGRCNITNAEFNTRALLSHYGEAQDFLHSPFSQFGVKETFNFFTERGLPLIVEDRKRAFPLTEKAHDVTRVLERYLTENNVTVRPNTKVRGFLIEQGRVTGVDTNHGIMNAKSFVLATGGLSHSETGSTGEGISWLKHAGHTTYESNPDIVPLIVQESWVKKMSGKSIASIKITFGTGKQRITRTGGLLFTHFGLSGPLILNVAREVKALLRKNPIVSSTIDLFPEDDIGTVRRNVLAYFEVHKNQTFRNAIKALVQSGMTDAILVHLDPGVHDTKLHSISKEVRNHFVDVVKELKITITGTMGYDWAVVSDGGVDLKEVDTKTMASTLYKNLFLCGDVLHINRPSGGFSLQLCWTTGWVAGSHV
jgi:predicted Rossmann fold flavoprotein